MQFLISATFTESLAKLTNQEQKAVKTTVFDLQTSPDKSGLRFHRIDNAKDANFWSVSAGMDLRLVVHRSASSMLLCHVDHHDKAYEWARRRKVETHPKTGAAQLVEVRETVKEIEIPKYIERQPRQRPLFAGLEEAELLRYGIPPEWIEDVRQATEDTFFEIAEHLPAEAAEAILELATGVKPAYPLAIPADKADSFAHPDAKRRFRVIENVEELERALEFPWEKWSVFLHPQQQDLIERNFNGPFRVSGSAGTGKTIVALHRAVHLAQKHPDARVLLTTFSEPLANALRNKLKVLLRHSPRLGERLEVYAIDELGSRLYRSSLGACKIADETTVRAALDTAAADAEAAACTSQFLFAEWSQVVDAWQVRTWAEYRDVQRLGRKTRLPEKQRRLLWRIFDNVRRSLAEKGLLTSSEVFTRLATHLADRKNPPYQFAIVDESQDVSVAQLRFLAALGGNRENALFFAGDLGQRIFQQPFSWKSLGVDIRGRSRTLRVNYRTSHQIRTQADRLLAPEISDVDGNREARRGTISIFNGPSPQVAVLDTNEQETKYIGDWIRARLDEGISAHEISVFVRTPVELPRATAAIELTNTPYKILDEVVDTPRDHIAVGTMHLAKGLEFRAVAVMACDDEVMPLEQRIENVGDDADLQEVYDTERHLLYVACTRARDCLVVTGVVPGSEFLDDLLQKQ